MHDLVQILREQAKDIADKGIAGWGNAMTSAADEIDRLRARNAELKRERDQLWRDLAHISDYADGATAYAPEENPADLLDGKSPRAKCLHIGDEVHNLACEHQNDEDLSERLGGFATRLWRLARVLSAAPEPQQPACEVGDVEPFVVKHYTAWDRPSIKGNGFDGLEVGEDREEAEEFIRFVNAALATQRGGE